MNKYLSIFGCQKLYKWISEYICTGEKAQIRIWIILESHLIRIFKYSNICAHHCKYKSIKVQKYKSTKVQKYKGTKVQKYKSTKVQKYLQKYKITWSRLIECDRGRLRLIKEGDWWWSSVIEGDWGWSRLIKGDQDWLRVMKGDFGWSRVKPPALTPRALFANIPTPLNF